MNTGVTSPFRFAPLNAFANAERGGGAKTSLSISFVIRLLFLKKKTLSTAQNTCDRRHAKSGRRLLFASLIQSISIYRLLILQSNSDVSSCWATPRRWVVAWLRPRRGERSPCTSTTQTLCAKMRVRFERQSANATIKYTLLAKRLLPVRRPLCNLAPSRPVTDARSHELPSSSSSS